MSLDLTGIKNENEYYSHHYVAAILEGDLKDLFSTWSDREDTEGIKPPPTILKETAGTYFAIQRRKDLSSNEKQTDICHLLVSALGFPLNAVTRDLEGDGQIHIVSEITRKSGAPDLWILNVSDPGDENTDPLVLPPDNESVEKVHFQVFCHIF
jgi:hypothetical protein